MKIGEYLQIGTKMKFARLNANMTQKEMASKLNMSYSRYSNYENSYNIPNVDIMIRFCEVLSIDVGDLLGVPTLLGADLKTYGDLLHIASNLLDLDIVKEFKLSTKTEMVKSRKKKKKNDMRTRIVLTSNLEIDITESFLFSNFYTWLELEKKRSSYTISEEEYKKEKNNIIQNLHSINLDIKKDI